MGRYFILSFLCNFLGFLVDLCIQGTFMTEVSITYYCDITVIRLVYSGRNQSAHLRRWPRMAGVAVDRYGFIYDRLTPPAH